MTGVTAVDIKPNPGVFVVEKMIGYNDQQTRRPSHVMRAGAGQSRCSPYTERRRINGRFYRQQHRDFATVRFLLHLR